MNPKLYILNLLLFYATSAAQVGCDPASGKEVEVINFEVSIPPTETSENDGALSTNLQGIVLKKGVPYSGYLFAYDGEGKLKSRRGYLNGKLQGEWTTYFSNGKVETQRTYNEGEKHGEHRGYYADGQVRFNYYFEKGLGQGTHRTWYADGLLSTEMNYKDGHELGSQKVWRPDGKLRSNYVVRENGRRYGLIGLKRCAKIDSESGDIDKYKGILK